MKDGSESITLCTALFVQGKRKGEIVAQKVATYDSSIIKEHGING